MSLKFEAMVLPGERTVALAIELIGLQGEVTLGAEDLDDIISLLGSARMAINDEVPHRLEPSSKVRKIENPVLHIHTIASGERVLCLRDPAYGWVSVTLSGREVKGVISALKSS